MRPFNETITWIRFRTNLKQAPPAFWLLLGENTALIHALRGAPMPPGEARSLEQELLAYGLLSRLALDGSPLRAEQVLQYVGEPFPPSSAQAHLFAELDNLLHAGQRIRMDVPGAGSVLDTRTILAMHAALVQGMPRTAQGWRTNAPLPGPVPAVPAEMIALFMEELCDWLSGPELAAPSPAEAVPYALVRSMLAELHMAWIQPFTTANHQVAGLVGQHLLAQAGLAGAWAHLPSIHFHRTRPEYQRQIAQAAQGPGDTIPFLTYALRGICDGLKEITAAVHATQADGQWRAHLDLLLESTSVSQRERQYHVLLALGQANAPVPANRIAELNPTLARLYAGVSSKTLLRDVDALEQLGAVQRSAEGLRARKETVLAFRG